MNYNRHSFFKRESGFDQKGLSSIIRRALREDIGEGDITTRLVIPKDKKIKAVLLVKEDCTICGLPVAQGVFKEVGSSSEVRLLAREGQELKKGRAVIRVYGNARSIFAAERCALNFLGMLSGIATKTREYAERIKPYNAKIMDTRKTIPGLRGLQKYAVRIGGGYNHRMSLDKMVLIKDNHLKIIESCGWPKDIFKAPMVEVEVKDLKEFRYILSLEPEVIMLDNMGAGDIAKAVKIRDTFVSHRCGLSVKLEASGGIDLKNIKRIASTGVDFISVGALTHSLKAIDVSLEVL